MDETGESKERYYRPQKTDHLKLLGLAGIVLVGGIAINQTTEDREKVTPEEFNNNPTVTMKVDGSKYLINFINQNGENLVIRKRPRMDSAGDKKLAETNIIDPTSIEAINGTPWDGKTSITLEDSLVALGDNPTNGMTQSSWFDLTLDIKGSDQEIAGFINKGSTTKDFIEQLTKGEISNTEVISVNGHDQLYKITEAGHKTPIVSAGKVELAPPQNSK